jgi:hypothetical protein
MSLRKRVRSLPFSHSAVVFAGLFSRGETLQTATPSLTKLHFHFRNQDYRFHRSLLNVMAAAVVPVRACMMANFQLMTRTRVILRLVVCSSAHRLFYYFAGSIPIIGRYEHIVRHRG